MVKSKRLGTGLIVLSLLLLSGCQDDFKQAEIIYKQLEKATNVEATFAKKQQELKEMNKEEQMMYDQILDLDIEHEDDLQTHIEGVQKNSKQQGKLLEEMNKDFKQTYEIALSTESAVKRIKDEEQKKSASETVILMEKRYKLFEAYYEQYIGVLKECDQLYEQLLQKDKKGTQLEKQIQKINNHYREMEKVQDQFNRCTAQYNKTKSNYYQLARLTKNI